MDLELSRPSFGPAFAVPKEGRMFPEGTIKPLSGIVFLETFTVMFMQTKNIVDVLKDSAAGTSGSHVFSEGTMCVPGK